MLKGETVEEPELITSRVSPTPELIVVSSLAAIHSLPFLSSSASPKISSAPASPLTHTITEKHKREPDDLPATVDPQPTLYGYSLQFRERWQTGPGPLVTTFW
jgi:hypothetical protein